MGRNKVWHHYSSSDLWHSIEFLTHKTWKCIVGETQQDLDISESGFIGYSATAYQKMYRQVAGQLLMGKKVTIEYLNVGKLLDDKPLDNKAKDHMILADSVYEKLQVKVKEQSKTNWEFKSKLKNLKLMMKIETNSYQL